VALNKCATFRGYQALTIFSPPQLHLYHILPAASTRHYTTTIFANEIHSTEQIGFSHFHKRCYVRAKYTNRTSSPNKVADTSKNETPTHQTRDHVTSWTSRRFFTSFMFFRFAIMYRTATSTRVLDASMHAYVHDYNDNTEHPGIYSYPDSLR
jgi:hypothetical protein